MSRKHKKLKIKVENLGTVKVFNLDSKAHFTVGFKPNNSFQIFGNHIPEKFELVRGKGDTFILKVRDSMVGELITGDSRLPIPDLIKHRLLRRVKDGYVLELSQDQQAWVKLNDVTFQLSFDGEARISGGEIPYWKFSRRIYRRLTSDIMFKVILILFLAVGGYLSYLIHGMPMPKNNKINLEKYTRHVARIIIKPRQVATIVPEGKTGLASTKSAEETPDKTPDKPAESASKNPTRSAEAARKAIMNKGLVGLIAGTGKASKESTVIEALVDRGLVRELDEILKSGQDLEIELPSVTDIGTGNFDDILSDSKVEVDNLISGMKVDDKVELSEKGDVNLEDFGQFTGGDAALGWRSEQSIRDVILSYMGRVTYTYNKYLKQNPDLRGKVIVEMTIAASGEVTDCRIVTSTVNNPAFEQDLLKVVSSFRFKPIPEGEITVQNPFIFYRRDL